jgi:isopentenyldiphosphate isomerase
MIRGEKIPDGYYRMVVHVVIFNDKGEMLIQQRQPFKSGWSGMWDITVGGSAVSGDDSRSAAHREVLEEIGLDISFDNIRPSLTLHIEVGFCDVYIIQKNIDLSELKLQPEEVKAAKWSTLDEILKMIDDEMFITYHKGFIELLFHLRKSRDVHTAKDMTKPV